MNNLTHSVEFFNLGDFTLGGDCDVEVDDGQSGYLKLRNPYMVNGYLNASGEEFKNGWFYPGDRAIKKNGQIFLLGRGDDVVNVGGIKISAQEIDDFMLSLDGVKDAACFWIKDKFGYNELWSAVVMQEISSLENLMAKVKAKFGIDGGPKRLIPVEFIPRTYSGKPQRNLMSEKVSNQINLLKSQEFQKE